MNSVANFNGARLGDINIEAGRILGRALEVAIPNAGSPAQQKVMQNAIQQAQKVGVNLSFTVVR